MARDVFPRTISRGPLVGQRFSTKWEYQQARAQALGFSTYGQERGAKTNPLFTVAFERARSVKGESRADAIQTANRIVGPTRIAKGKPGAYGAQAHPRGVEMSRIIAQMVNEGLYDTGDDAADDLFYD